LHLFFTAFIHTPPEWIFVEMKRIYPHVDLRRNPRKCNELTADCVLLRATSAQVLYNFAHLKGLDPFPVLRSLTPQFDPLAGFQVGAAGQERIGLVFLVIDQTQSVIATLDTSS
jgi:hypothetical protein